MLEISYDIQGEEYRSLITKACERYSSFSLVWRDQLEFSQSASAIRSELSRFQISRSHTDQWPGTQLVGHRADVIYYNVTAAKTGILLRATSLFGWRAPKLPEDIAFYRSDGTCAMFSISHEHEAVFLDPDWLDFLRPLNARHNQGKRSKSE